ncbi:hypothetical protein Poly51_61400 [Rubripirellula tenax]|uniref:Uncharacterized protein n=1 Tax=Rubripirellula tenax TaxID=2528015 RepID=A0A5C6E792_9BACT|nr:hypothetical protein Poly51_61400 [Rubripirellula tenax]
MLGKPPNLITTKLLRVPIGPEWGKRAWIDPSLHNFATYR